MPATNITDYQVWANITLTGGALAQATEISNMVNQAIEDYLGRKLDQSTYTSIILNAPRITTFQLFRYTPIVISSFQLWYNPQAHGNPALFTSAFLQTPYTDYIVQPDRDDSTVSKSGIVTNLWQYSWGIQYNQPPYAVDSQKVDLIGAIQVAFTGGYVTIPSSITLAGNLAISRIRKMAKLGVLPTSESWNGESFSLPNSALVAGVIGSPEISSFLLPYVNYADKIG